MPRHFRSWLLLSSLIGPLSDAPAFSAAEEITGPAWRRHVIDNSSRGADGVRLADANGDGLPDVVTAWEQGGVVRLCLHPGRETVRKPWPSITVGRVEDGEDALLVDLDSDGHLDIVSCSEGKTRSINVHWSPRQSANLLKDAEWKTEPLPAAADRMMWMFALPLQVDGKNGLDLVAGGKGKDAAIGWFQSPEAPRDLSGWTWHELRKVGWLMSLVPSDMDGDGDIDIVFTDRKGPRSGADWLENPGPTAVASQWREHPIGSTSKQAMFLTISDLDRDGLEDVLVAVQPKEIHWHHRTTRDGRSWRSHTIPLPEPTGIAKAVSVGDLDLDGRLDLVLSCEQAKAPAEGLVWMSHSGDPALSQWTAHRLSGADGVKHDLVALVDLDGDGDLDAMTTEEVTELGVIWYENPSR